MDQSPMNELTHIPILRTDTKPKKHLICDYCKHEIDSVNDMYAFTIYDLVKSTSNIARFHKSCYASSRLF